MAHLDLTDRRMSLPRLGVGVAALALVAVALTLPVGAAEDDTTIELPWAPGVTAAAPETTSVAGPEVLQPNATMGQVEAPGGLESEVELPASLTPGADGALWFSDPKTDRIGRIGTDGVVTTFTDSDVVTPSGVTLGPDGNVWFGSAGNDRIGRITPGGEITTFPGAGDAPASITLGADGNLWFTNVLDDQIGRATPSGTITLFPSGVDMPLAITSGPDGNLWYTGHSDDTIGRMTTGGVATTYTDADVTDPLGITTGPDGALWFTHGAALGRITVDGTITTQHPETGCSVLPWITTGPDGRLWTTCAGRDVLLRFDADGRPVAYDDGDVSTLEDATGIVVTGADGALWFADGPGQAVGRLLPGPRFSDVGFSHPAYDGVDWVGGVGVATGFDDGTYRPSTAVSRAAMAAFLHRLAGSPATTTPATPTFPDVGTEHPFLDEVEWLADQGITEGYADGTYRPNDAVSRGAMAMFLHRFAGSPATTTPATPTFPDVGTEHPFLDEVEWLADQGITQGYADGTYRPSDAVSRGAMAMFLYRFDEQVPT